MAFIDIKIISEPFKIVSVTQFHEVTGRPVSEINRKISSLKSSTQETYLDCAFPFPSKNNAIRNGMKFVVLNQKGLDYARKYMITDPEEDISLQVPGEDVGYHTIVKGKDLTDDGLIALIFQKLAENE